MESVVGRRSVGQFLFGGLVGTTQGLVLENAAGVSVLVWVVTCAVCLGGTDTALKFRHSSSTGSRYQRPFSFSAQRSVPAPGSFLSRCYGHPSNAWVTPD